MTKDGFVPKDLTDAGVESETNNNDPFSHDNVQAVQLVVQMRVYDVLMAILRHLDKDSCEDLYNLHAEGKILGSLPFIDLQPEDLQ